MTKISELSSAGTITGNEIIPLVDGTGENIKIGIGATQVLQSFGDLPPAPVAGTLAYVPDAAGGPSPVFSDGNQWGRMDNSQQVVTTGQGIWVVFCCAVAGPALSLKENLLDNVYYWWSDDGITWIEGQDTIVDPTHVYLNSAYANGCIIASGQTNLGDNPNAFIAQTQDPTSIGAWSGLTPPDGYEGAAPGGFDSATYDNPSFTFTVRVRNGENVQIPIANGAPASASLNDSEWPYLGQETGKFVGWTSRTVAGVGTQGPMEVRIVQAPLVAPPTDFSPLEGLPVDDGSGTVIDTNTVQIPTGVTPSALGVKLIETCWLEWRRPGNWTGSFERTERRGRRIVEDPETEIRSRRGRLFDRPISEDGWQPVRSPRDLGGFPSGGEDAQPFYTYAGRLLKGLVWGVFFQATLFPRGSN